MWLILAFVSAVFLGFYDVCKKSALTCNSVIEVLLLNTFFSTMFFVPLIFLSLNGNIDISSIWYVSPYKFHEQIYIFIKSLLVLLSWLFAYLGLKHLPITIVSPINATRPVWVLIGAMFFFHEKLSFFQWIGIFLAIVSFYFLNNSGKKEGIFFKENKWILFVIVSNIIGAFCGLYDKYLLAAPDNRGIQIGVMNLLVYYNLYQFFLMLLIFLFFLHFKKYRKLSFRWRWSILFISVFLSCAEIAYFYALTQQGALISVVSMIRRSSVVVAFCVGAWIFKEKNIKSKIVDLVLILISMVFLCIGN